MVIILIPETIATVEPQGFQEVPAPIVETNTSREVPEVHVTVKPQVRQEDSEPLAAIEAEKEVHDVLVSVEPKGPQGPKEVPESLTATKPIKVVATVEPQEVLEPLVETRLHEVTVEPQGPQEVPEPLGETKPLEVTEVKNNPMPQEGHEVLPSDRQKKTPLRFVNIW